MPGTLEESARGLWHLAALANHADILFTGHRGSDTQPGAVFRAFRDLGIPELGDVLQRVLDFPVSPNGKPLRVVIKRMRNSFSHRSYDIAHHGPDFAFWGLGSSNTSGEAFANLIVATSGVLKLIEMRKQNLIAHFVATGTLADLDHYISSAPERAVQASRARRRAKK